jgi:hypothetical protein
MYPHLITDNTITIIRDGAISTITSQAPSFSAVLDAIKAGNWDEAVDLMTPRLAVESYAGGSLTIDGGNLYKDGHLIDHAMVSHILTMRGKGFDVAPLMAFLDKVLANPSTRSRNQIWRFVSTNNITITPQGNLLFYKKVKSDYYDIHTGHSYCYTVGSTHSMPRSEVNDDPEVTCSFGLHVCSYEYLRNFRGDRTLICEVDPAHIVSVPIDYENTKVRVCQLTVHSEVENPTPMATEVRSF